MDTALDDLPRVAIDGAELAYREDGAGEPVVLVHGSLGDLRAWDDMVRALAMTHRVIAPSRRYAPPNDPLPDGAEDSMRQHVDDLVHFLRQTGAAPAHLVGHSWGGYIALLAALREPDLVRSLILFEAPVVRLFSQMPPSAGQLARLMLSRPAAALALIRMGVRLIGPTQRAYRRGDDEAAMRRFVAGMIGPERLANMPAERYAMAMENIATHRSQMLQADFQPVGEEELGTLDVPVMLVHGTVGPAIFRQVNLRLAELLPRARVTEMPGASHVLPMEEPERAAEVTADFIRRVA